MERYGSGFKKKKERKGGREKERHVWVEFKKTFGFQVESFFQWDEMRSRKVYGEKDSIVVVFHYYCIIIDSMKGDVNKLRKAKIKIEILPQGIQIR